MQPIHLTIILGSSRPKRRSIHVARFIAKHLEQNHLVKHNLVDVKDFDTPYDEAQSQVAFREVLEKTDGFIVVFPEYNHSYPGRLKSLLDTEYDLYAGKPAALVSVSSGDFGGVRATQALIPVLTGLKMVVTGLNLHVAKVRQVFDEQGSIIDDKFPVRLEKLTKQLVRWVQIIKAGKKVVDEK